MVCMEVGDLVTGVDRRYARSIYKLTKIDYVTGKFFLKFISYLGFLGKDEYEGHPQPLERLKKYRLATPEEVTESARHWTKEEEEALKKSLPGRPYKIRYRHILENGEFKGHCLVDFINDDDPGFEDFDGEILHG
jgi:hypothetical protein